MIDSRDVNHYCAWRSWVRACFEQPEEFDLASAIYDFQSAWEEGMTAREAYEAFDRWTREDDVA
jgi:hypothetical protein